MPKTTFVEIAFLRDAKVQWILSAIGAVLLFLVFKSLFVSLALVAFLLLVGIFSQAYKMFVPVNLGLELITFSSILFMFAFNPLVGLASAFVMTLTSTFFVTRRVGHGLLFKLLAYTMMSIAAFVLLPLGVAYGGMALVVIYNVFLRGVLTMGGANPAIGILSFCINFALTSYLLASFGPILVAHL